METDVYSAKETDVSNAPYATRLIQNGVPMCSIITIIIAQRYTASQTPLTAAQSPETQVSIKKSQYAKNAHITAGKDKNAAASIT